MKKYWVYLLLSFGLLPFFQYQFNPDAGPLIDIAKKYLAGNFSQAINGYWSPLYSWLLIPFLFLKINPLIATKIINIGAGLISLIGINNLTKQLRLSQKNNWIILLIASIFLAKTALIFITPDLLLTAILIWCLIFILEKKYISAAILGILAYLTKTYAFYFFLIYFLLMQTVDYFSSKTKKNKRQIIQQSILTLGILFLVSSIWILIISNKYQQITIGTTGKYNFAAFNPDHPGLTLHNQGLLTPSNQTATSAWEDPSYHKIFPWNPLQKPHYFWQALKNIKNNFYQLLATYQEFSILSLTIIAAILILCFQKRKKILIIFLALLLFPLGYLLFGITDRFVWFNELIIFLFGGYLLDLIIKMPMIKIQKILIMIFFVVIFCKPQISEIKRGINIDKNLYELSQVLKNNYQITNSRIATINEINDWNQTYTIAYHTQNKYYGMIQNSVDNTEALKQIKEFKIDYLFVYGLEDRKKEIAKQLPVVFEDKKLQLTIYHLIYHFPNYSFNNTVNN